uniref:Uncharacterized protein n=1 Tax=Rhizophora mucronata TaxID=61149 RepID=A0A2P2NI23_RHIMU
MWCCSSGFRSFRKKQFCFTTCVLKVTPITGNEGKTFSIHPKEQGNTQRK